MEDSKQRICWDDIFGLESPTQRFENRKQNNVEEKTSEALSDELKTKQSADASVSPAPSDAPKDEPAQPEEQNTSEKPEAAPTDSDETMDSSDGGSSEPDAEAAEDPAPEENGGDDEMSEEPAAAEEPIASSPDPELPKGANPNRTLNGKLKLSQEIHNLINEMESALETFEQISLKNPVVVKLRELKESTELLLDTVASVPIEDTMVRYELFVRTFRELVVKHLKNQ